MLAQLKDKLFDVSSIGSIELQIDPNGNFVLHWVVLSKKKQILNIEQSGTIESTTLGSIADCIPVSVPLVLSLTGKGVLHKKIKYEGGDKEKMFNYVFPNARIQDYMVQYVAAPGSDFYVSVVRKDQIERIIDELKELGYPLLSLSLGPFAVLSLLNVTHSTFDTLSAGRHRLVLEKNTPVDYHYASELETGNIDIEGTVIPSPFLVAYANAFQYLLKGLERIEVIYPLLESFKKNYQEKKIFKLLTLGGLCFFFLLLVINVAVFSIFSEKNNKLSAEYGSLQNVALSNKKNSEEFDKKESFLSKFGWLNPAAISFYSDQIASSLPNDIKLTDLLIYPTNEALTRKEKKEVFETNAIVIKGISNNPTDINGWTKQLNDFKWISQVKVQDYTFDHKTGRATFSLYILISGELE